MKQVSSLVLIAAVALLAVVCPVATAQAEPIEPPTFGYCLAGATPAEYSDEQCTSTSGRLYYAWIPLEQREETFFGKGKTRLRLPSGEVSCTSVRALGYYVDAKDIAEMPFHFSGCTLSGQMCTTAGAKGGEIVTGALHGLLGFALSEKSLKKPPERVTALQLTPEEEGAPIAQFDCGVNEVALRGALVPRMFVKPVGRVKTLEWKLNKKEGRNWITGLEGSAPTPLQASVDGGPWANVAVSAKLTWPYSDIKINTTFSSL